MKKIISLIICFILIFSSCIFVSASTQYNVYGSITEETSQVKILLASLMNRQDWVFWRDDIDFLCVRTGQYEYRLWYNIESDKFPVGYNPCLVYYADSIGNGQFQWHLIIEYTDIPNIYNPHNYTMVGSYLSIPNDPCVLNSTYLRNEANRKMLYPLILIITLVLCLFVFRVKKRGIS